MHEYYAQHNGKVYYAITTCDAMENDATQTRNAYDAFLHKLYFCRIERNYILRKFVQKKTFARFFLQVFKPSVYKLP